MKKPIQFISVACFWLLISFNAISQIDPNSEYSPSFQNGQKLISSSDESKDLFDLIFEFPCAIGGGEAGIECDGQFIYTTKWNGDEFYKYDMLGNYIETFIIANVSGIRDLAWDGTYFYGGAASSTVFEMDFNNQLLISTFLAPTNVRAIAYHDFSSTFYANNWGSDITKFDHSGNNLGSFMCGPIGDSYYGFDISDVCVPAYLYGYAQVGANSNEIVEIDLIYEWETGVYFDVGAILNIGTGIAGGLCSSQYGGDEVLIGNCQNEVIWGLELCTGSAPCIDVGIHAITEPTSGVGGYSNAEIVSVQINNYGIDPQSDVVVSFTYNGSNPYFDTAFVTINVNDFYIHTFDTTVDMTNSSTHDFEACTWLAEDENPLNDCKTKTISEPPLLNTLEGYLTNANTGSPIEGAMIDFATYNVVTGADGYFSFVEIPDGTYDLSVGAGGYCPWDTTLTFASNQTIFLTIGLIESIISFSDDTLSTSMQPDMTAYLYFDVSNPGTCDIDYYAGSDVTWLGYPTTISGEIPSGETLEINWFMGSWGLDPGIYEGHIIFQSGAISSPDSIHVILEVLEFEPPDNLTAYYDCTNICLEWDQPSGGNLMYYNIYRDGNLIANFSGVEFCDQNLFPETEYCYQVTAVYQSGESNPTPEYCITLPKPDSLEPANPGCTQYEIGNIIYWDEPEACLGPDGYNLYRNDSLIESFPNTVFSHFDLVIYPGLYEYALSALYYFGESDTVVADCIVGVEEQIDQKIDIYPNPVEFWFVIRSNQQLKNINIYNNQGTMVKEMKLSGMEVLIQMEGQPPGVYLLKVENDEGIFLRKIVVK
ncbi:MAG: T9SS type A sorting domain-containing protein [Bacteroidales bacterium]|nr:T9SS type A sorting domain-containing protein [Bacteroidales bacterium]MCF8403026.1 T9SS type A sorting domain-containing protein [Bacteroidales bacterium]